MSKRIFKITVTEWLEHNAGHKKSYKKTQIANNFCTDARIVTLPLCVRLLFLGLILECGNSNNETITINERQINTLLTTRLGALNALNQLKSLQMVTYEIIDSPLQKRNELNRNELKGKEVNSEVKETEIKSVSTRVSKADHRGCISEFSNDEICNNFLANVTHRAQKSWLSAYPSVDWIVHEVRKANAWCETNSKKAPKDRGKFMLNWLNRGFEEYRKTIVSKNKPHDPNAALREKLMAEAANENNPI